MAEAEGWRTSYLEAIRERNRTSNAVGALVSSCRMLWKKARSMEERALNAEDRLRLTQEQLRAEKERNEATDRVNADVEGATAELAEERCRVERLREELNAALREKSSRLEEILQLNNTLTQARSELDEERARSRRAEAEVSELKSELKKCHDGRSALVESMDVLRSEYEGVMSGKDECERRVLKAESENRDLIDRMIAMKAEQVDKMNEIDKMLEEARIARAEAESMKQAAERRPIVGEEVLMRGSGGVGADVIKLPEKIQYTVKDAHKLDIHDVQFDPLSHTFATCSDDKTVKLWDSKTMQNHTTLGGSMQSVLSVGFHSDGNHVVGACADRSARVWAVKTGQITRTLTGHTDRVVRAKFFPSSDRIVTAGADRCMKVYDLGKGGNCVLTLLHPSTCNALAITTDNQLITGHFDGGLRLWDLRSGEVVVEMEKVHTAAITDVEASPTDMGTVGTTGKDDFVTVTDVRMEKKMASMTHPSFKNTYAFTGCGFSPNGAYIACGGANGNVYAFDVKKSSCAVVGQGGHKGMVTAAAWSTDGENVVTSGKDKSIVFWTSKRS